MNKTTLLTCVALCFALSAGTALGGKKVKLPIKDETLYGPLSCAVVAPRTTPVAPPPAPPAANGAPQNPAPNGAVPAPGANPAPPPPPPISTVRDCLAKGGRVVIHPDGGREDVPIENPELVKGHEWHRVSITGYLNGTLFHIMSLRAI
jgi:hypothetical protein